MKIKIHIGIIAIASVLLAMCPSAKGTSWQPMDSGTTKTLQNVWGTASDNVYAVGDDSILHYNGYTWETLLQQTTTKLFGISGSGPDNVYVIGNEDSGMNTVLRYNGNDWVNVPMPDVPYNIYFGDVWVSGSDAFAVGYGNDKGQIIRWRNGNLLSHDVIQGPLGHTALFEVWGRAQNDVYASGYNGYSSGTTGLMYHYNGSSWEPVDVPTTRAICGIWGDSDYPDELFLSGQSFGGPSDWFAEALYYNGSDWQSEIFHESHILMEIWGTSQDDVYIVGWNGMILHGNNDFLWSQMDSGTTEHLYGIWGSATGEVFAVGINGTILYIPEPATLLLLTLGGVAILKKRKT